MTTFPVVLNGLTLNRYHRRQHVCPLKAMRAHWEIENKLHWKLDVAMKEDNCRIRRDNAAELLSGVRHITVNMLTWNTSFKAGLKKEDEESGVG